MKSNMYIVYTVSFCIALFFVLSSCNLYNHCNKIEVSKEYADWADCYNLGDTIVLKSNLDNYDTLIVSIKKNIYAPCNKFELGPNQNQRIYIELKSISKDVDSCRKELMENNWISLRLGAKEIYMTRDSKRIDVYNLKYSNSTGENHSEDSLLIDQEIPVLLKVPFFEDSITVYKYDDKNSKSIYPYADSEYPCAIKSFHWSKEYGLVQYETEDNEVYKLEKISR